jgi:plasmid stability protein
LLVELTSCSDGYRMILKRNYQLAEQTAMASITVRGIPDNVYRAITNAAELSHRSINKEIIACLERSYLSRRVSIEDEVRKLEELRKSLGPDFTWGDFDEAKRWGRK